MLLSEEFNWIEYKSCLCGSCVPALVVHFTKLTVFCLFFLMKMYNPWQICIQNFVGVLIKGYQDFKSFNSV